LFLKWNDPITVHYPFTTEQKTFFYISHNLYISETFQNVIFWILKVFYTMLILFKFIQELVVLLALNVLLNFPPKLLHNLLCKSWKLIFKWNLINSELTSWKFLRQYLGKNTYLSIWIGAPKMVQSIIPFFWINK